LLADSYCIANTTLILDIFEVKYKVNYQETAIASCIQLTLFEYRMIIEIFIILILWSLFHWH